VDAVGECLLYDELKTKSFNKEKYHVVHHHRNSNHPMVARLFGFEHKSKFPENRRMDPYSGCSCRNPHHSKSVGDHLDSHLFENKRQLDKQPLHTKEQHSRTEVLKNYRDENGQPLDPTKLNLEDLQGKNAPHSDFGQGFSLLCQRNHPGPPTRTGYASYSGTC
jgi:hypothetical protein